MKPHGTTERMTGDTAELRSPIEQISANIVELEVDSTGKCWLNVDGVCKVRIGATNRIVVRDPYSTQLVWDHD